MVRGRLGPAVNDFRRLWDAGTVSGLSDARLLEQFTAHRDEAAFDCLMARHGPLVWSVCRSVLTDPHDVEDAFQASFLILVRKAHSLRVDESLCGWLYRVSYRVAQEARAQRDVRRRRERAVADRVAIADESQRAPDELIGILNHEINRLPEKYRLPIVLCELEGLTRKEAAGQLDWPQGTVATRLARGQDLLRQRLRRRLGEEAGGLHACLGGLASTSVPAACREATTQAALAVASKGWAATGNCGPALLLAQSVQRVMFWTSLRSFLLFALSLAAVTWASLEWIRSQTGEAPRQAGRGRSADLPSDSRSRLAQVPTKATTITRNGDPLKFAGQVLDPDGKPRPGASVCLDLADSRVPLHQLGISDADGRFRATVVRQKLAPPDAADPWKFAKVVAAAPGFGPVWVGTPVPAGPTPPPLEHLTLRLVRDNVPIEGRIVSPLGQPVRGARVVALRLSYRPSADGDPVPVDRRENDDGRVEVRLADLVAQATTDSDGRFRMTGLGPDRLVSLRMVGHQIAEQVIRVFTQNTPPAPAQAFGTKTAGRPATSPIYGASFVHVAEPGRSLEGVIRDQQTGQPIAGAVVNNLATDREGHFQIDGLTPEFECTLVVRGPAGGPYFSRRLTVASHGTGPSAVTADIALDRGVPIRGRLTDRTTGKPIQGKVAYVPLRRNPHGAAVAESDGGGTDVDDTGHFVVTGLPGQGVLIVTARLEDTVCFPMLEGVTREDRRRGVALADDEVVLDTQPRPVSLVGSHAYKVIDVPDGKPEYEVNFDLALHRGRTITARVVDAQGGPLRGVIAYGLRNPTANSGEIMRGDESFAVHDLDSAWPRRVFSTSPNKTLQASSTWPATSRMMSPRGCQRAARLSAGSWIEQGPPCPALTLAWFTTTCMVLPISLFPTADGCQTVTRPSANGARAMISSLPARSTSPLPPTKTAGSRFATSFPARLHFHVVFDNAARRLGLKAPAHEGKKLAHEGIVSAGQIVDLEDIRIRPEELRGNRRAR